MAKCIKFNEDKYLGISNDASASVFGYLFQAKVALWLFLRNIKDAKSVKVETKNQDIEIIFDDRTDFIQVKAQQSYSTNDNARQKLKAAIISLSRTVSSGNDKLVYVNNFKTPLLINDDLQIRMGLCSYNNLSSEQKEIVNNCFSEIITSLDDDINKIKQKKAIGNTAKDDFSINKLNTVKRLISGFDKEKLMFGNIYPCSEREENSLLSEIGYILANLGINIDGSIVLKNIYDDWIKILTVSEQIRDIQINKARKLITKEVFSWSIASETLNENFNYDRMVELHVLRQIHSYDKQRVCKLVEDGLFDLENWIICNKIINEFTEFCDNNKNKYDYDFINSCWSKYLDDLSPDDEEDDVREALARYKIYQIVNKQRVIIDIQKKVGCRI